MVAGGGAHILGWGGRGRFWDFGVDLGFDDRGGGVGSRGVRSCRPGRRLCVHFERDIVVAGGGLTSSDGAAGDGFGTSVSISGSTIVVGASAHAVSGHAGQGAAYVFTASGSTWSQAAELTASDGAAGDGFGTSVGVSGSSVTVGAPGHAVSGHAGQGAAYVFTLSGSSRPQSGELTASDGASGDQFGDAVTI